MDVVTCTNLDAMLERFAAARGGLDNHDTESEACFVTVAKYGGIYMLHTGFCIMWVGLQNCSARASNNGDAYPSVRAAIERMVLRPPAPISFNRTVYYSDDSSALMRWAADQIDAMKASGESVIWA